MPPVLLFGGGRKAMASCSGAAGATAAAQTPPPTTAQVLARSALQTDPDYYYSSVEIVHAAFRADGEAFTPELEAQLRSLPTEKLKKVLAGTSSGRCKQVSKLIKQRLLYQCGGGSSVQPATTATVPEEPGSPSSLGKRPRPPTSPGSASSVSSFSIATAGDVGFAQPTFSAVITEAVRPPRANHYDGAEGCCPLCGGRGTLAAMQHLPGLGDVHDRGFWSFSGAHNCGASWTKQPNWEADGYFVALWASRPLASQSFQPDAMGGAAVAPALPLETLRRCLGGAAEARVLQCFCLKCLECGSDLDIQYAAALADAPQKYAVQYRCCRCNLLSTGSIMRHSQWLQVSLAVRRGTAAAQETAFGLCG